MSVPDESHASRWQPLFKWGRPLVGAVLFAAALLALDHQLKEHSLAEVRERLQAIPATTLGLALGLASLAYLSLTTFDMLAIRHLERRLPYPRVILTSFIAYVFSIDLGLNVFGSSAIRYRLYSQWGLGAAEIGAVVAFTTLTFWLGVLGLGGVLLTVDPLPLPETLHVALTNTRPLGIGLLALLGLYVWTTLRRREPIRIHDVEIRLPRPTMTAQQLVAASAEWLACSGVLWVLMPSADGLTFLTFLAIFMAAEVLALVSTVPAGLGVFEGVMLALLSPYLPAGEVLGPLIAYRIIYYLLPIFVAVGLLGVIEAATRRESLGRVGALAGVVGPAIVPRMLALTVFVSGLLLILAGVAPAAAWHVAAMRPVIALPVVEVSHLLSVVCGVGLVFLARGIQRRVDATWSAALGLLAVGVLTSLLRGSHLLLAGALAVLFLSLLPCRSFFYRKSSLLSRSVPGEWVGLFAVAIAGAIWFALWANGHISYAHTLWSELHWDADAARALRALGLVSAALVAYGALRLTRPRAHRPDTATAEELDRIAPIVAASRRADAHLALLGDKSLLFDPDHPDAVLMYGVSGRSWVAMGDPIGPPEGRHALAWRFREMTDQHGGWPVFYEVGAEDLPTYLDLGLSLHKLGEDARVPLADFSFEGSKRKSMRAVQRRCERAGGAFEVIPPEGVGAVIDDLERVSDAWLAVKHTREKGFSLGAFDRAYMQRQPVAVVRVEDTIVAFANLWYGADGGELSPDLMRYDPENAPPSVMEYLFGQLMLHGKEAGYAWFGLGMAPLSGLSQHRLAPVWNRLGSLLYQHGEHFYNFQGLRQYKDKFEPVWEPRYLASPGGLSLPVVLTHVSSLISGGIGGVVSR